MPSNDETLMVVTITRPEYGNESYTVQLGDGSALMAEIELSEPGDEYHLKVHEMTCAEYDALPEFDGW